MSSCMASSFSQGDAFISSKPERTTTFTSSPPSRREERQQSIAVLPPPSTITRLPILSIWPNETLDSQSMPIWMFLAASLRPGISRSRPRGAPQPTKIASKFFGEQRLQAVDALAADKFDAEIEDVIAFLVDHGFRQAEFRNLACASCRRISGPGRTRRSRSPAARDRAPPRARPGRRRPARCACRFCWRRASAGGRGCRPCSRRRRASGGRSRPALFRRGRAGRPARTAGRRCGRECPETHSIPN